MTRSVFAFSESIGPATQLADHLGLPCHEISVRHFPDGESLVRVPACAATAVLYRSLDNPNAKLVEVLLAAAALRDGGARRITLVAPYLAYMRQDMAFSPGEAISQKVIGRLIASHFDALVTIDPHLHRVASLAEAVPGITAVSLSAAPVLSDVIAGRSDNPLLVGPDSESRQWVEAVAAPNGFDVLVGEKRRRGDRDVALVLPGIASAAGRPAILVDDLISSGATLVAAARLLRQAGASGVEALVTHCLASEADLDHLRQEGISPVRATDTIAGPAATIPVAGLLAEALLLHELV